MQLSITHTTAYRYDEPVQYALQKVRLRPADLPVQQVTDWRVDVDGGRIEARYKDHFGNQTDLVSVDPGAQQIVISAVGTVVTSDTAGILGKVYGRAPLWLFQQETVMTKPGPLVRTLSAAIGKATTPLDGFHAFSAAILGVAPYQTGQTDTQTSAEDALALGHGVCQDHANIMVAGARLAGFPARYVSGYLMMNDRVDQDASHAWAEVYLKDLGWVGFDVSNGVSPDERYVRIAIGRDSREAAPMSGMRLGASNEAMIVSLQVQQ